MRKGLIWFLGGVMAIHTGCNVVPTKTTVVQQPEGSFGRYQIVEVLDFEGDGPDPPWPALPQVSKTVRRNIADAKAQELKESKLFAQVNRESADSTESVLRVTGQVFQYDPGRPAKISPFSRPEPRHFKVRVKFIEKASGIEVAEAIIEGKIKATGPAAGAARAGLLGMAVGAAELDNDITETHRDIAREIVQFIRASF